MFFGLVVFFVSEATEEFAVGVHGFELCSVGVFDFNSFCILFKSYIIFSKSFGSFCKTDS